MKIKVLGTAAAEGFPALWCECETCKKALEKGGKDIRKRTSYLIDSDTIVDFGPDALAQTFDYGIDLLKIERLIFTHSHSDHLNSADLVWRKDKWFSQVSKKIKIFGSKNILGSIMSFIASDSSFTSFDDISALPVQLSHGVAQDDGDLRIMPLAANHAPGKEPFVYVLSRGGKSVLIGNDTGWLPEQSWKILENAQLDLAFIDSTMGVKRPDSVDGHMGANVVVKFNEKLKATGALKKGAQSYAIHFSHNGGNLHADLEKFFKPYGIKVASDGLELTI